MAHMGNKSVVRIILEILQDGNTDTIMKNTDLFIDLEKAQLELAYMTATDNAMNMRKEDFIDYYMRTYLKDLYEIFNRPVADGEKHKISCDLRIGG